MALRQVGLSLAITLLAATARGQDLATPTGPSVERFPTVAEKSGFEATSTSTEVIEHLDALATLPLVRRASMGTTHQGRDIPMVIIADPPVATPEQAKASGKLTVFLFGNIHAGECDGKEALGMLARTLATEPNHPLLRHLVVIIAPNFNADSNDKIGPTETHRPGQIGPAKGCGIRENAQGLDLNRDFIKLKTPEVRALVNTVRLWDPAVVVDCHTTNGSHHRYLVTYAGPKSPAGDPRIVDFSRNTFMPKIAQHFESTTGRPTFWYGNFEGDHENPPRTHTRWETFPAEARFGTTYLGLRGKLSVLVESYSYASYKDRVLGSLAFCTSILHAADAHRDEIRRIVGEADQAPPKVAILSKASAWPGTFTVKGFVEAEKNGRSVSTGEPKDYEVELWDRFTPALEVDRPAAYIIPSPTAEVQSVLAAHGLTLETTAQAAKLTVQVQRITSSKPLSRPFQNQIPLTLEAETREAEVDVPAGSLVVRTDGLLGRLAVYLLEPMSEDGLATWNYFDAWAKPDTDFPVLRAMKLEVPTTKVQADSDAVK
ncbi:MAG: hypothetical protein HEQ23_00995 [Tepidisphaera sp.]